MQLDSILAIIQGDNLPPRISAFIQEYKDEASTEWFDTADELIVYFKANHQQLLEKEYMKLNLKYLGKLLLDRDLAALLLDAVASTSKRPVARELARFSLDRTLFIDGMIPEKEISHSRELVDTLAEIYPTVRSDGTNVCRFLLAPKQIRAVENELKRFLFDENPARAVALTLQNYGDKMIFNFAFGDEIGNKGSEVFTDSFDYASQLSAHAKPVAG